MRHQFSMRRSLAGGTILAILFSGTSASADALDDLIPPMPNVMACWSRTYDEAHLAKHPQQKVTRIVFQIEYVDYNDENLGTKGDHLFSTHVTTRERSGWNAGPCYVNDSGKIACGVECDGGGFVIKDIREDGSILLDLETRGYIALNSDCGEGDEVFPLDAEPDDKLFLLHTEKADVCLAQFAN